MANQWSTKAIYYRETTDGKTRWVKIPEVLIRSTNTFAELFIDPEVWTKNTKARYMPPQDVYQSEAIR